MAGTFTRNTSVAKSATDPLAHGPRLTDSPRNAGCGESTDDRGQVQSRGESDKFEERGRPTCAVLPASRPAIAKNPEERGWDSATNSTKFDRNGPAKP